MTTALIMEAIIYLKGVYKSAAERRLSLARRFNAGVRRQRVTASRQRRLSYVRPGQSTVADATRVESLAADRALKRPAKITAPRRGAWPPDRASDSCTVLIYLSSARTRLRRFRLSISLLLFLCAGFSACQQTQKPPEGKRYELKGKVVAVDRAQQLVTISHGPIRDYMDAMTMPFHLKDTALIPDIAPGDQIQATLFVASAGTPSWLEDVVITKPGTKTPAAEQANTAQEASPGDAVPDFSLVNQDGKRIHLQQYKGKALLLTFIYTRCPLPEYCTLMSENFAKIDQELHKDAGLYNRTHLLSVSIDPDYDRPTVLRSYGGAHTGNYTTETFGHWEFVTGTKDEVKAIAQFFGLTYYAEADQITHSLRTAIITPAGKVYKVYNGNEWKPEEVNTDLVKAVESKK